MEGYDVSGNIYPLMSSILDNDVKREILLRLPDNELFNVCRTDSNLAKICRDLLNNTFWWQKLVRHFGVNVTSGRPNKVTDYKKLYKKLIKLSNEELYFEAAREGYLDLIKSLISSNSVKINAFNDRALRLAAFNGNLNVVMFLIETSQKYIGKDGGINIIRANIHSNNDEAFISAVQNGHIDIVKFLLQDGQVIDISGRLTRDTANIKAKNDLALISAAMNGDLNLVKYLLQNSYETANIHAQNDGSLIAAALLGNYEVVKFLIEQGQKLPNGRYELANIKVITDNHLMQIASEGHSRTLQYLKTKKAESG